MVRNGVRRCNLCAAEILGHNGEDICVICRICAEEEHGLAAGAERMPPADVEDFSFTAVMGCAQGALDGIVAANDEQKPERSLPAHRRRRPAARRMTGPQGAVSRFAANLRSMSWRRSGDPR